MIDESVSDSVLQVDRVNTAVSITICTSGFEVSRSHGESVCVICRIGEISAHAAGLNHVLVGSACGRVAFIRISARLSLTGVSHVGSSAHAFSVNEVIGGIVTAVGVDIF